MRNRNMVVCEFFDELVKCGKQLVVVISSCWLLYALAVVCLVFR